MTRRIRTHDHVFAQYHEPGAPWAHVVNCAACGASVPRPQVVAAGIPIHATAQDAADFVVFGGI